MAEALAGILDWSTVATVILTMVATLTVTYLSHRWTLGRERSLRRQDNDRRARFLAIRLVTVLEPFVDDCAEYVGDRGRKAFQQPPTFTAPLPRLSYPDDVDWTSIDPKLMFRILNLENELDRSSEAVQRVYEESVEPPDYEFDEVLDERRYRFSGLGLEAARIVDDLRELADLDDADWQETYWNPVEFMTKARREESERRASMEKTVRKLMANTDFKIDLDWLPE